jgi:hypothetical protein
MKKKTQTTELKTDKPKKTPVIIRLNNEDLERAIGGRAPFLEGRCPPATG